MSGKFVILYEKENDFRKFILLTSKYKNLLGVMRVHEIELSENIGEKECHKRMMEIHREELKRVVEERAHALSDLLDGKYSVEELNTDTLAYDYNYLTREVIFYE